MKRAALLCILGALLAGCPERNGDTISVTGQIEGITVSAGSRVGGRVSEVLAEEGASVKEGNVLIRLEAKEAQALVDAAKAQLAQAEAMYTMLDKGARAEELRQAEAATELARQQYVMAQKGARNQEIAIARKGLDAARAQRNQAKAAFERAVRLLKEGLMTPQQHEQAEAAFEAAEAQFEAAREKLDIAVEGLRDEEIAMAKAQYDQASAALELLRKGARVEEFAAAKAAVDAARADLARAEVGVDETIIIAPRNGVIESLDVRPGDLVKPGAIVRIADPEDLELVVYVSAILLGYLQVGQKVPLVTDAHGNEQFEGTIIQIATQGEYTPRNLQTKEERVQQVFGVTIKLDSAGGKLRAGMSATALLERPREGT